MEWVGDLNSTLKARGTQGEGKATAFEGLRASPTIGLGVSVSLLPFSDLGIPVL